MVGILLKGDVLVELLGTIITLRDKVEAHTSDMFLGTEVLEVVYLLALNLQFQQASGHIYLLAENG